MKQREETKSVPPRGTLKQARFRQHQNRLNQRIPPPGDRFHSANRSPDLASSYLERLLTARAAMAETHRHVLRRPLHGFRESPGITPGSHGWRIAPPHRVFPRRCAGYSFVGFIIREGERSVNLYAGNRRRREELFSVNCTNAFFQASAKVASSSCS